MTKPPWANPTIAELLRRQAKILEKQRRDHTNNLQETISGILRGDRRER